MPPYIKLIPILIGLILFIVEAVKEMSLEKKEHFNISHLVVAGYIFITCPLIWVLYQLFFIESSRH